jgi:hypothetical protein
VAATLIETQGSTVAVRDRAGEGGSAREAEARGAAEVGQGAAVREGG